MNLPGTEPATKALMRLAARYREMPNGGAVLSISPNGEIGNGMAIVAQCENRAQAVLALNAAGFTRGWQGWRLGHCDFGGVGMEQLIQRWSGDWARSEAGGVKMRPCVLEGGEGFVSCVEFAYPGNCSSISKGVVRESVEEARQCAEEFARALRDDMRRRIERMVVGRRLAA